MTTDHDQNDAELRRALARLPKTVQPPEDWWPAVRARLAGRKRPERAPLTVVRGGADESGGAAGVRPARIWSRPPVRRLLRAAAGIAILGAGLAAFAAVRRGQGTWRVAGLAGTPLLGRDLVAQSRVFPEGDWLVTDDTSRALVEVGAIGHVEVDPNTRMRLVTARATEHRLKLERGRIHTRISAPPRLFFVETPSATAVDLGCAYTLEVDSAGTSVIHVTLGWVSFERGGHESLVPAGMRAVTRAGRGVGTPFADDAPEALRLALAAFDFAGGGDTALAAVLREARARDAITLWHLLARTTGPRRAAVYERLAGLVPPPPGVTRDGALRLERVMLRLYWEKLPLSLPITPEWTKTLWRWWLRLTSW